MVEGRSHNAPLENFKFKIFGSDIMGFLRFPDMEIFDKGANRIARLVLQLFSDLS
jgi:hypothetical protein